MNTSALAFSFPRRQHGAVSLVIIVLLVFILSAAVMAVLRMSGSSVTDSSTNEAQVSALSLAESGLERAQATLTMAGFTNAACTGLAGTTSNLGRGTFTYTAAVFNTGVCTVTVAGTIGTSSRTIRAALSNTPAQGAGGNGSTIPLRLITGVPNAGVITNLAYPAGSTASIGSCTNPAACSDVLTVTNTGASGLSNRSVYESVAASGVYAITQTLVSGGSPAPRNYVQVGAVFPPTSGNTVGFVGAYAANSGSDKTAGTGGTGGSVPAAWNCAPNSGPGTAAVSAGADTLVYGFSSLAAPASQMNGVTLDIPLIKIRNMSGTQGDNLYSQIWYSYNPAYISPTGATNDTNFTGSVGATGVYGSFSSSTSLQVSKVTSGELRKGDKLTFVVSCMFNGQSNTVTTYISSNPPSGNKTGTYTVNPAINATAMAIMNMASSHGECGDDDGMGCGAVPKMLITVQSKILDVSAVSSGRLSDGDIIILGIPGSPTITFFTGGGTGLTGDYLLPSQIASINSKAMQSPGTTITLVGATTTPVVGTALDVSSGLGAFDSARVTGSISGTILTVTGVTSGTLHKGDALFGGNIEPDTHITVFGSGSGGNGTYTVNNSQTAVSGAIVAKAAVLSVTSANSYEVSRKPTTRLSSSAQVCGGVCAFLSNGGAATAFTLANIISGADWSSGFTCLKNVNPATVGAGEVIDPQRRQWSEVVQ
jgi:hypothetical protein